MLLIRDLHPDLRQLALAAMMASVSLLSPTARAESPSTRSWQAQWIGPSTMSAMDLTGASWIWVDEPGIDPTRNARAGTRFFRCDLVLDAGEEPVSAVALFAADNHFKLMVNGTNSGGGDDWQHPARIDIAKALRPGTNRIVVQVNNDPDSGAINAAGLIGRIRIETRAGRVIEALTNSSWVGAETPEAGPWKPVRVIGNLGIQPWGTLSTGDSGAPVNLWTCYRKRITLQRKPERAIARIAVDSKYWLWINGRMVVREGGLKRGPNPQDTYFDTVDLTTYLSQGENQIAVLAWYFGKDGFSHKSSGKPGLLVELEADGVALPSDRSWKCLRHPSFGTASNQPNFRLAESSVRYDARQEPGDWTGLNYDDHGWSVPEEFGAPPVAPWNRLWERSIPQWRDFGLKDYLNASELPKISNGSAITARMPHNAQVTPWLRISSPAGATIRIHTDNALNEILAEYVTREGDQAFETPAWMSGHSVVYEIPAGIRILGLQYRESGFDTEFTGHFECDNAFLNKLWMKCERTLYINMRDSFFDCPDRERAQWWGDIVIQLGQVFRTFDCRSHSLIRKCIYNLTQWQRVTKTLYSPIPAGNWNKELPQQMLASIGRYGFWTYYLNTGDKQTLEDVYPHVKDYLSIWQFDAEGLVVHRSGENGWDWADWGTNVDIRVLDQAWFCLALEGAALMADELGKPNEAAGYRRRRESVIAAVNARFWNGKAYRDPAYMGETDDRAQGMAVVSGIAGSERYPAIRAVLAKEFHASPYLERYVLESLFMMNAPSEALSRMQSRYKEMVESETSTLWELFTREGTLNHAWTGGPLTLLAESVAGITATSPGCSTFRIKPQLGGLTRVNTGFDSVKGRVEMKIARQSGGLAMQLHTPAGSSTHVCLPVSEFGFKTVSVHGIKVWSDGRALGSVPGLKAGPDVKGHASFIVDAGDWKFEAR